MKETKIYKFPRNKGHYSDEFLSNINPAGLVEKILKKEVNMPYRVCVALANCIIAKTYYDLAIDEEEVSPSKPVIEGFCTEEAD
tara:strand:+ start:83 stop:334 length:252 start_codon:yes stop_codon:yes gene_type:complete